MGGEGAWLGAKTGFILSIMYCHIWIVFSLLTSLLSNSSSNGVFANLRFPAVLIYFFGVIMFAGLPSLVFGGVTGTLLGLNLSWRKKPLGAAKATSVGVLIGFTIAVLTHLLIGMPRISLEGGYPFMPGGVSLVYIIACGWMSRQLSIQWIAREAANKQALYGFDEKRMIIEYILAQQNFANRYDIDLYLLRAGYSATEVEAAWRNLK